MAAGRADVVVVGGGPAGLVAAVEARRRGLDVVVVDRRRPPIDKACGEGIMPDGVERLRRLGVRLPAAARPLRGIRYLDADRVAEAEFPAGHGLGVRRPDLHRALVERAAELGVELRWGVAARGLLGGGAEGHGVDTDAGPVRGRWVVGADGLHSRVRRWAGLERRARRVRSGGGRFGVRRHYRLEPWTDLVEVHWAEGCEAYVTPVGADQVGVALLWSGEKARFDGLLERFPGLGARLAGAAPASRDRGAGPLARRPRAVQAGCVALVGDAAGYLDAITGEGLSLAFHQARALARALAAGDLAPYGRAARRLAAVPFLLIRALLVAERRPKLRRRLVATLAESPALFARLLAVHARAVPLRRLGLVAAGRLAWGLAHEHPAAR